MLKYFPFSLVEILLMECHLLILLHTPPVLFFNAYLIQIFLLLFILRVIQGVICLSLSPLGYDKFNHFLADSLHQETGALP